MTLHPVKTQISLGIRPIWSESPLSAWRNSRQYTVLRLWHRVRRLVFFIKLLNPAKIFQVSNILNWENQADFGMTHWMFDFAFAIECDTIFLVFKSLYGPRQASLVLIAYASSEGSGEPAHPRSLARTFAARSYKQWIKRNLQKESQIPGPSEWLGMRS